MQSELFAVTQYCVIHNVDPDFIASLEGEGLIRLTVTGDQRFIEAEQLPQLETFTRWHHDLGINVAGIDAIHNLLERLRQMQSDLASLKSRLRLYESDPD